MDDGDGLVVDGGFVNGEGEGFTAEGVDDFEFALGLEVLDSVCKEADDTMFRHVYGGIRGGVYDGVFVLVKL